VSSQKIRRILAAAALIAGVTWLAACPSMAVTRHRPLDGDDPSVGQIVADESNTLAMAAGEMARQMGLTGLAGARSAMGPLADLGGIVATWGMPSLTGSSPALFPAVPGPGGMSDLATMAEVPALPELPAMPGTPITGRVPTKMTLGQEPYANSITGHARRVPVGVQQPVREIGGDVITELLPKAVDAVEDTPVLPGGAPVIDGFGGLLRDLDLH
jgi:hypothetical protein